jgi:hypothetical protein
MRIVIASIILLLLAASEAQAGKQHRYVGEHPIAAGGFCHIHAPHVHVYAPVKAEVLYRDDDGWNHFVGDPVAYGYEGPRHAYHGAHPIHFEHEVEYCYVRGPHFHIEAPPAEARFEVRGDVLFYVGDFEPRFHQERPKLAKINVVLEPIVYARPVVVMGPPPGWHDVLVVEAHAVAPVVRAGVEVNVPAPVIDVSFGFGVAPVVVERHDHVVVHEHRHHKHKGKKWKHKGRGRGHW